MPPPAAKTQSSVWPCCDLDFDPHDLENLISSSLASSTPITTVWWNSDPCFVRYRANNLFGKNARTDGRTPGRPTPKHNAIKSTRFILHITTAYLQHVFNMLKCFATFLQMFYFTCNHPRPNELVLYLFTANTLSAVWSSLGDHQVSYKSIKVCSIIRFIHVK